MTSSVRRLCVLTAWRKRRATSRSRRTSRPKTCSGERRCVRPIPTRGSCRSIRPKPGRSPGSRRSSSPTTCQEKRPTDSLLPTNPSLRATWCATWVSRSRPWRPTIPRPAAAPSLRSRSCTRSFRCSPTWTPPSIRRLRQFIPTATSFVTNASSRATRMSSATSSSRGPTTSVCRTKPSSVSKPHSPIRIREEQESSSSSQPSGCTRTANKSPTASTLHPRRFDSFSVGSAEPSARARTSPCRFTLVSSHCARAAR